MGSREHPAHRAPWRHTTGAEDVLLDEETIHVPSHSGRLSAYGRTRAGRALRVVYDQQTDGIRVTTAYQIRRRLLARIQEEAQK
jgi:hypothetical protein